MSGPSLRQLAWLVTRDVNRTFGGGIASMELMRRALVRQQWLDDAGHGVLIAVSRFTPGTNLLAYCAALGWMHHGMVGAVAAVTAGSLPSSAIVALLTAAVARVDDYAAVRVVLAVATLGAAALVFSSAWVLMRPLLAGSRRAWAVTAIVLAGGLYAAGATPVRVLGVLAAFGALTPPREPS